MNVIIQCYQFPFLHLPTSFSKANNASARSNSDFVSEAVNDPPLEEIFCVPDIVHPISVSTRSTGKRRLILDLRLVNAFIYKQKFKCENLSVATQIFDREVWPEHRKYCLQFLSISPLPNTLSLYIGVVLARYKRVWSSDAVLLLVVEWRQNRVFSNSPSACVGQSIIKKRALKTSLQQNRCLQFSNKSCRKYQDIIEERYLVEITGSHKEH